MLASDPGSHRIRLFRNDGLELMTVMPPRVFALVWALLLPLIAWVGLGGATPTRAAALAGCGLLVWSLFEYAMHRWLFHLGGGRASVRWLVFLIHGNHHDNPCDPLRQMMPLSVSLPLAALAWGLGLALLGPAGTWLFLGWITGYVIYDAMHYACHQWPLRGRIGAALKRHHMRHHHVDEGGNFAISAIFWDRAFGSRIHSLKR